MRTKRIPHNHIYQWDDGVQDCPACESVEQYHLTHLYFIRVNAQRLNDQYV